MQNNWAVYIFGVNNYTPKAEYDSHLLDKLQERKEKDEKKLN